MVPRRVQFDGVRTPFGGVTIGGGGGAGAFLRHFAAFARDDAALSSCHALQPRSLSPLSQVPSMSPQCLLECVENAPILQAVDLL